MDILPYTKKAPGIYVHEEVGIRPIQAADTSTPAFIGFTMSASKVTRNPISGTEKQEDVLNIPQYIPNWTEYTKIYGDLVRDAYMPDAVYAHFNNGGGPCYVVSTGIRGGTGVASLEIKDAAGTTVFVVRAIKPGDEGKVRIRISQPGADFKFRIGDAAAVDANMTEGDAKYIGSLDFNLVTIEVKDKSLTPVAVDKQLELPATETGPIKEDSVENALKLLESFENIRLIVCPDAVAGVDFNKDEDKKRLKGIHQAILSHCAKEKLYRFAILDTPKGMAPSDVMAWLPNAGLSNMHAAIYYPWVGINEQVGDEVTTKYIPPSGFLSGQYGNTDLTRGVHKAPANDPLLGVIELERRITSEEQAGLNQINVNCIREFPNQGIRVWGARTLSSDLAWRYINVRRLFDFVESSLEVGLKWVVFEPNNPDLWARVTRDVTSFLKLVWRSGALFGTTPEQAFYVKCDEELNPLEVRDQGVLIIQIGMAPVKPAEFVILQFRQWAGPNAQP